MKIYTDFEQRSPKWFEVKKLHFTASHATAIKANGKGLETLVKDMVREYYSSRCYEEYTTDLNNKHVTRGCKFEDIAKNIYELETGNKVDYVAFVETSEHVGCSPDGFVGDNGLIEIKNPDDKVFYEYVTSEKIDSNHYNQMQMQMYCTKRDWCDYFVFNPNFTPSFILKRVHKDPKVFYELETGLKNGTLLLKRELNKVKGKLETPTFILT